MYVVIAGAGQVGTQIAKVLLEEGHSVAVIESDRKRFEAIEGLDVLAVQGNAASPAKLREAGINSADMVVAATGSDETNIIACVIGKSRGAKTIARLSNSDYMKEGAETGRLDLFSIDMAVSPDMVTASQVSKMLLLPSLVESRELSQGQALIMEMRLNESSGAVGRMPASLGLPGGAIIGSVVRYGTVMPPDITGAFKPDDRVILVLNSKELVTSVEKAFGVPAGEGRAVGERLETGMHKLVIVGATRMGIRVAKSLENDRVIVLIDKSEEKCVRATEILSNTLIINGDATDSELFMDEGIEDAGALVAATENAEYNMLCCLLAEKWGVGKTLAIVDDTEMRQLFEQVGVDVALSPRMMTVNTIIQHISGKHVSSTLSTMQGSGAKVMEVLVKESLWMVGKEYGHLKFPKNSYIGSVIRQGKVIVPTNFDIVRTGDRMIIFVGQESLKKVERMFSHHSKRGLF